MYIGAGGVAGSVAQTLDWIQHNEKEDPPELLSDSDIDPGTYEYVCIYVHIHIYVYVCIFM
jgi:hypothetical protein